MTPGTHPVLSLDCTGMEIGRWRLNQFPCVGSLAGALGRARLRGDALGGTKPSHLQSGSWSREVRGCEMHTHGINGKRRYWQTWCFAQIQLIWQYTQVYHKTEQVTVTLSFIIQFQINFIGTNVQVTLLPKLNYMLSNAITIYTRRCINLSLSLSNST